MTCTQLTHDLIKASARLWAKYTRPLDGYSVDKPAIQDDGEEVFVLANCVACSSTIARVVGGAVQERGM